MQENSNKKGYDSFREEGKQTACDKEKREKRGVKTEGGGSKIDNKKKVDDKCHEVSKLNTPNNKSHNDKSQQKQKTTGKQADTNC